MSTKVNNTVSAIGAQIKHLRKSADMSQEILATKLGLTKQAVSTYETGKANPTTQTIVKLSEVFGIDVSHLLPKSSGQAVDYSNIIPVGPAITQGFAYLRFVPIVARATFAEMGDAPRVDEFDTIAVPIQPNDDVRKLQKCWVFEVNGDSMEPTVNHGQRIVAEPINEGDWEYQSDRVYVVSYAGYLVVKRIKTNDLRKHNYLELWSDNEKKGGMKVAQRREIKGIWKVLRFDRAPDIY
jgi:transcriptional regulator with XRE-family HTH domain